MFKWFFIKVFKVREQVAIDLGMSHGPVPLSQHFDDLLTMLLRMAATHLLAVMVCFFWAKEILCIIRHPILLAGLSEKIMFTCGLCSMASTPQEEFTLQVQSWMLLALMLSVPILLIVRTVLRTGHEDAGTLNFK